MADKRLSVERIYQKKSQLEHILLRPDTYIGSVQVGTFHLGCRRNSIFRPGCVRNMSKPSKKIIQIVNFFLKGGWWVIPKFTLLRFRISENYKFQNGHVM